MAYLILCRVSGGVTGTREAFLKQGGVVQQFDTLAAAQAKCAQLSAQMNHEYATASFSYTPIREGR
jgi:hypothetical protein